MYNNLSQVYVTFSASSCGTQYYALGLLTWAGGNPTKEGSWTKSPESVLSSANGNYGTGHNGYVGTITASAFCYRYNMGYIVPMSDHII